MKLLIVSAGCFSTEVNELAKILGFDEIAFLDDDPEKARSDFDTAMVTLGSNEKRKQHYEELKRCGY